MKETVLQFGTGNFLRAFIDPMLDTLHKQGLYSGAAVIVSPTDSAAVEKLNAQECRYRLMLRGIENGKESVSVSTVESVSRAVNPYRDFDAFLALASQPELRFIVSNTTEAGIVFDESCTLSDRPQASFPGKLTGFLYERYSSGLPGFIILPCELIDNNGSKLKECVSRYAALWGLPDAFSAWLEKENVFCNTLVDRIVTGFPEADADACFERIGCVDKLLDTSEPYHLWVIEGDFENELPLKKAGINVIWTDDVAPYKKMKVRILNGLHTSMVFPGLLAGKTYVADCMNDPVLRKYIDTVLHDLILPTLENTEEIKSFAAAVEARFLNPYLRHKLQSISLNSVSKFSVRILPTLKDCVRLTGEAPKEFALALASLIRYYKTNEVKDDVSAVEAIIAGDIRSILHNTDLWGEDLGFMEKEVCESMEAIEKRGIEEALEWSCS
ncbi:MAG: tagaturonate reductase [Clostridia bacterium]|nr:tagaturonate reductase [Clostridia bacterium]